MLSHFRFLTTRRTAAFEHVLTEKDEDERPRPGKDAVAVVHTTGNNGMDEHSGISREGWANRP